MLQEMSFAHLIVNCSRVQVGKSSLLQHSVFQQEQITFQQEKEEGGELTGRREDRSQEVKSR